MPCSARRLISSLGLCLCLGCASITDQYGNKVFNIPALSIDLTQRHQAKDQRIEVLRVAFSRYLISSGYVSPDHIWSSFTNLGQMYSDRGPGGGGPPLVFFSLTQVAGGPLHLNFTVPMSINQAQGLMGWTQ